MNKKRLAMQAGLGALLLVGAIIFFATPTAARQTAPSIQEEEKVSPAPVAVPAPPTIWENTAPAVPRTVAQVQPAAQAAPTPPAVATAPPANAVQQAPEELTMAHFASTVLFLSIAVLSVMGVRKLAAGRGIQQRTLADGAQV